MWILSTITSPVFSELIVVLTGRATAYLPQDITLFEALRMMSGARRFELVFLLEVSDFSREEARRRLAEAVESVTAKGFLDFLDTPPTIRIARSRPQGWYIFSPGPD